MTATIIDLPYRKACRDVDEAIANIRTITARSLKRLEAETVSRRARIETKIQEMEASIPEQEDVEWMRPTDSEVPMGG